MRAASSLKWKIEIGPRQETERERERERESYLKHQLSVEIGGEDFTHVIEKGSHGLKGGDDVV